MADQAYFIGLISGTSIDGVNAALVSFESGRPALHTTRSHAYPDALQKQLHAICNDPVVPLLTLGQAHVEVGIVFAEAAVALLDEAGMDKRQVSAIGSHGQTLFHKPTPPLPFSLQIGDPSTIAQRTGIATVADFRSKDLAVGGQGAPLAPLFHQQVFAAQEKTRVVVNLGGIANITVLKPGQAVLGFDTGPANVLMDYWVNRQRGKPFDSAGAWAASGEVIPELLELLLDEPYFVAAEPKSTGREQFNAGWLESRLVQLPGEMPAEDIQATLLELTASTVATEIDNQVEADEVYVCGGGAHNTALLSRLQALLPDSVVTSTAALGIAPDWVEAMTFAWLAQQRMAGKPVGVQPVTGASQPVILGGVYLPD